MKKGILLMVCLCLATALSGCRIESSRNTGIVNAQPTKESHAGEPTVSPKESAKPSESPKATANIAEEEPDVGVLYTLAIHSDRDVDEEKNIQYTTYTYEIIQLDEAKYSGLASSLDEWNRERIDDITTLTELARSDSKEYSDSWQGPYCFDSRCKVQRADSKVFSFCDYRYYEQGGPHGSNLYKGYNFDTQTGKKILLKEIIKDTNGLADALETKLFENYDSSMFFDTDLSKYITEHYFSDSSNTELQFILGYKSITFYFSTDELAPFAAGMQEVTLTYDEYPELLYSEYCSNAPANYAYVLANERSNSIDINEDGTAETITISGTKTDDAYEEIVVNVNGQQIKQEEYFYTYIPYFVKCNGKSYIYVQLTSDNASMSLVVFDVTRIKPRYVGVVSGGLSGFFNPNYLYIEDRLDVLSTYNGKRLCHIGANGLPVYDSSEYEALAENPLVSTVPLKGEIVDPITGKVTGTVIFPKETSFRIVATDNASYIKLEASDGRVAKFEVTLDWPQTINGVEAEKCFETLWYAG